MRKCKHCGKSFSDPVWRIHKYSCGEPTEEVEETEKAEEAKEPETDEPNEEVEETEELEEVEQQQIELSNIEVDLSSLSEDQVRAFAKERNISHYWVKSIENIILELKG